MLIPHTPVDFTGDGAAHSISSIIGGITAAKWFQVSAVSTGTRVSVGDSGVAVNRGFPVSPGSGQFAPPVALAMEFYDLEKWFVWVANGDTVSVGCA